MRVEVRFQLSLHGRKVALLAGQDASALQTVEVAPDDPAYRDAVELGDVDGDAVRLTTHRVMSHGGCQVLPTCWDRVPTAAEVVADEKRRIAELAAAIEAAKAVKREETLAVLRERKTSDATRDLGLGVRYVVRSAAWPWDADPAVKGSEEAAAWEAELTAANVEAQAEAEVRLSEAKAAKDAAAKAAADKEVARRATLGLRDGETDWSVADGVLTEVPVWEDHRRGKNWMAVIDVDPRAPGGLDRQFADKARGQGAAYVLPVLKPGDALEFGADYISGSGKRTQSRWYCYVVRVEPAYLVLRQRSTGKAAVEAGRKHAAAVAAGKPVRDIRFEEVAQ